MEQYGLDLLEPCEPTEICEVETFEASCGRGLRTLKQILPGEVVLADKPVLPPCADADEFAAAASSLWTELTPEEQMRLMALRWRSNSAPPAQAGPGLVVPATGRLRGIASFNGMAVVKLVMKPSALKTLEAQPCNGVAVYLNGSMLNHSCFPTVNRLPFSSCLVVRASRDLFLGEELVCAYTEVRAPFYIRQAELESTWAFRCCCWRCLLEERVWAAAPEADRVARSAWRRFERRRKDGTCSEEELRELVNSTADSTKTALAEFLVAIQDRTDLLPAEVLQERGFQRYQAACQCTAADVRALDLTGNTPTHKSTDDLLAFYRLLLASFWAAPAFELAFGLQESQRYEEAHQLWLAVRNVTAELLPFSPSHTAAATEASLSAMAAESVAWEEHVQESVRICCGTYGSGAWLRLAAGRLEHLASPTRRQLEECVANCERLIQAGTVPQSTCEGANATSLEGLD
ncbi:unnamed protein product [Durusdinium trenchii]|uniref:Potential protein lysine methyltransferase SET5 (SET domain-containing protein 5) n=2 Tax=Durusdinium trenchii TaxID=1381693 RepID=A0ABP0LLD3_9DINO